MATLDTANPLLGVADILQAIESWPPDRRLALARELAGALPSEAREEVARELLKGRDRPPHPGGLSSLRGSIPIPDGWPPEIDASGVRERRLSEKHGPC